MSVFVSVTRLLNEDDVIEAFVRHTACFVDRLILLDNGSTDRTLPILEALRLEGLPLVVLQSASVFFVERDVNTMLYHTAVAAYQADWVLFLDADEFIDEREARLRPVLEATAPEIDCAIILMHNYYAVADAPPDLLVPRRLTLRDAADRDVRKCLVRGGLPPGMTVEPGNHGASRPDRMLLAIKLEGVTLAHYPVRDAPNGLAKAVIGWLKVLAAGQPALSEGMNVHYQPILDVLRDNPAAVLQDGVFPGLAPPAMPLVHDPAHYAGGELRHTTATDPGLRAVRRLAAAVDALARSHGALLDADPAARQRLLEAAMQPRVVIS